MKRMLLPLALVLFAMVVNAQDESEPETVSLPDSVMRQVVERVVVGHFKTERPSVIVYFSEQNIKRAWLPKLDGIKFEFADGADGKELHFFRKPERDGKDYKIDFGWGDPDCDAMGETWSFRVVGKTVRDVSLVNGGWGTGCNASASRRNSSYGRHAEIIAAWNTQPLT